MPVPSAITDLSTTAASNSPAGSDNVFPDLDNYLRAHASFIAQNYANKAALASPTFTGTVTVAALTATGNVSLGDASGDTLTVAPSAITWSNNPTHSGNHTYSGNLTVSGIGTFNGNNVIGNASTDTLTIAPNAVTWSNDPTHSGNHTYSGNLTVSGVSTFNGNTVIGNASGDTLTVAPSAITWSNNPTHSGNHTFSGNVTVSGTFTGGQSSAKAWVAFDGTGVLSVLSSFNVTSVTDNGTGDYTVNFTTAMSDANYAALVTGGRDSAGNLHYGAVRATTAPTTTALRIGVGQDGGATGVDSARIGVAVFR